ncbi:hypothetical protein HPB48_014024 [Haemaphysalis longicornis]|uniref:Peptidase M13 N-terminal domain-containing protein n=1 Tax=Haemaphysalis longicornis TaxID=44386 RepID=A0A9J6G5Y9_HAELO|nr:hypothetical protein HPB48_014024 [Haemaphysalis longicornis]
MQVKAEPQKLPAPRRGGRKRAPGGMLRVKSRPWARFSKDFVVIVACQLLSAMAVLMAMLLGFEPSADDTSQNSPYATSERHIDLLSQIWNAGNTSLDPCKDFYLYSCYNIPHEQTSGKFFSISDRTHSVLQGLFHTEAARLLFLYYGSCIKAPSKPERLGRQAIRAVLSMTYVSPDMSHLQVLALILKLNLAYGLHGNIVLFQDQYGTFPYWLHENLLHEGFSDPGIRAETLFVFALPNTLIDDQGWTREFFGPSFADLIEELLHVGVNVTSAQLTEFAAALDPLSGDWVFSRTNLSTLDTLVPGVSTRLWKDMVEAHTARELGETFVHSCLSNLKRRFAALLDKASQPLSTAAIVTEAALSLLLEYSQLPPTAAQLYDFCANEAFALHPVWELNELMSFGANTEHNDILLNTFDALVLAIKAQLVGALNEEDMSRVDKMLNNLQLLLPYHVYPLDLPLPSLVADDFFLNILLVRQWRLTTDRYRPPRGIADVQLHFMRYGSLGVTADYLSAPTAVYRYTMLDRTFAVTPMAVFGFSVADLLWRLLANLPWTPAGRAAFERLLSPDKQARNKGPLEGFLHYPLLALKSSIHGLRMRGYAHWNAEIHHWGQWRFTITQLFFRILVYTTYCYYDQEEEAAEARHVVSVLTRLTEDFLEAFQCTNNRTHS